MLNGGDQLLALLFLRGGRSFATLAAQQEQTRQK
jgi:hypothetical protein